MNTQKRSLKWYIFDFIAFAIMMTMTLFILLILLQYVMCDCTILEATRAIIQNKGVAVSNL